MTRRLAPLLTALIVAAGGCTPKPVFRNDPAETADTEGADVGSEPATTTTPARPAPEGPVVSRPGTRVEEVASTWLGTPYRYGGVDERGIDCSALTQNVMGDLGVTVPRTTRDQRRAGRPIDRGDVRAGDLVFFRLESSRVDHVGIALGPDRFVHASTSRGVVVDRLMDDYFSRRFVEARRVLSE